MVLIPPVFTHDIVAYTHHHWAARYGLDPRPPALLLMALLVEGAMHLRARRSFQAHA